MSVRYEEDTEEEYRLPVPILRRQGCMWQTPTALSAVVEGLSDSGSDTSGMRLGCTEEHSFAAGSNR